MIKNRSFGVVWIKNQNSFILQNAGTMAVTSHCWDGGSVVQYSLMNIPGTSPDPIVRANFQPHQYQVYIFLTGPALSGSLVKTFGFGAMLTGCGIVCFLYCPLLLLLRLVSIWSVGWLGGWFYGWSVIQSVGELVDWLIDKSHEC